MKEVYGRTLDAVRDRCSIWTLRVFNYQELPIVFCSSHQALDAFRSSCWYRTMIGVDNDEGSGVG